MGIQGWDARLRAVFKSARSQITGISKYLGFYFVSKNILTFTEIGHGNFGVNNEEKDVDNNSKKTFQDHEDGGSDDSVDNDIVDQQDNDNRFHNDIHHDEFDDKDQENEDKGVYD